VLEADGTVLRTEPIPVKTARIAARACDEAGIGMLAVAGGVLQVGPGYPFKLPGRGLARIDHPTNAGTVGAPATRIIVPSATVAARLREELAGLATLSDHFSSTGVYIDTVLTAAKVTKASGLETLLRTRGFEWADVLALGDSESDTAMLRRAGVGIAMGQAPDGVRSAADHVGPSCDDAGVAWAVERFAAISG